MALQYLLQLCHYKLGWLRTPVGQVDNRCQLTLTAQNLHTTFTITEKWLPLIMQQKTSDWKFSEKYRYITVFSFIPSVHSQVQMWHMCTVNLWLGGNQSHHWLFVINIQTIASTIFLSAYLYKEPSHVMKIWNISISVNNSMYSHMKGQLVLNSLVRSYVDE